MYVHLSQYLLNFCSKHRIEMKKTTSDCVSECSCSAAINREASIKMEISVSALSAVVVAAHTTHTYTHTNV